MIFTYKILIIAPAWVGDAVMSLGMIHLLKQKNPKARIFVLSVPWCQAVFKECCDVDQVIPLPIPHGVFGLKIRWDYGKNLQTYGFDIAYILPNSWKSALIPFFAKIPKRIGFLGEGRWGLLTDIFSPPPHLTLLVDKYQFLVDKEGGYKRPQLQTTPPLIKQSLLLKFPSLSLKNPIMALCPGAEYGPAKRWPSSYYGEVARFYLEKGGQIWIFGSMKEKSIAREISDICQGNVKNWVGKTSLEEAIQLLGLSQIVLTNDSGLMHIAAALDLPTIALFGSSSPSYTPPLSPQSTVLYLNLGCSPCFQRQCPLTGTHHLKCLTGIFPKQVIQIVKDKMNLH